MSKVAVIIPSRGLIFSRTADEILQNVRNIPHKFFFSHKKPIPQCFEDPTNLALADKTITHLWFVEDDMILPPDILQEMLDKDLAAVTADYPVHESGRGAVFEVKKQVIFTGTGCLLVKREVFDELKTPYFRTDIRWNIKNYGDHLQFRATKTEVNDGYGLHDVNFCMSLYRRNIPIHKIDRVIGQRKLVELGKAGTNNGAHNIKEWTKIKKDHLLKQVKKWPVEKQGNLVTVISAGKEILVSESHAKKLIKANLATKPPKKYIVIDDSEIL